MSWSPLASVKSDLWSAETDNQQLFLEAMQMLFCQGILLLQNNTSEIANSRNCLNSCRRMSLLLILITILLWGLCFKLAESVLSLYAINHSQKTEATLGSDTRLWRLHILLS